MNSQKRKVPGSRSPNDFDRLVGTKLRQLRLEAGLTLQDLAGQLGISHQQLQKYETATNRISVGMLPGIAEVLGVDIIELFEDAAKPGKAKKSAADKLRSECETWIRRTKSEEALPVAFGSSANQIPRSSLDSPAVDGRFRRVRDAVPIGREGPVRSPPD